MEKEIITNESLNKIGIIKYSITQESNMILGNFFEIEIVTKTHITLNFQNEKIPENINELKEIIYENIGIDLK